MASIRDGILAVLTQGAAYGLQLRNELDARTRRAAPLNVGQVYGTLDRLLAAGLISQEAHTEDGLPLYELTETGHAAASAWLGTPDLDGANPFESTVFQVLIARSLPGVSSAGLLEAQREAWRERHFAAQEAYRPEVAAELRSSAEEALARAVLGWLDEVEPTSDQGTPVSRVRPPRGRPATEAKFR
ncbi:PadR family transcriptional regulator [Leucobacter sp. M11]|uniref:PadR family transcriptional regulator n=1 Tax=Leucobacter sp. M11 TaxID=2993565 RepID=UPI002D8098A5|nr:PadR family transcriptional regulator [Leucobacter sp. M11]MEB4616098.1 PadR family transcriptional regulator [Leucobacter sp. M11]